MKNQIHTPSLLFSMIATIIISINLLLDLSFGNDISIFVALILISTIGIYHGAFDINKASLICKKLNLKLYKFNMIYVLFSLTVVALWIYFPFALIASILTTLSSSFGSEEYLFYKYKPTFISSLLRGLLVLILPLTFHFNETVYIFKTINIEINSPSIFALDSNYIILALITLSNFIFSTAKQSPKKLSKVMINIDMLILVLINFLIEPLAAFTIYFCFLHSARNIYKVDNHYKKSIFRSNKQVLNISYLTLMIFSTVFLYLSTHLDLSASAYNTIFIGLAALTFPHIATDIAFNRLNSRIKSS